MNKSNLRTLGRVLAGLICVVGFSLAPGCSQSKCGKSGQCSKGAAKSCNKSSKSCDKGDKCCKKASAKKCGPDCKKACCKKA